MMGTDMSGTALALFSDHIDTVAAALSAAGHTARPLDDLPVLLVDGSAIVGDNLEADPGLGWNVSARLDDLPFEAVLAIARTVRAVAPAARVIAVGGHGPAPLPRAVRSGAGGTAGLDTPASGFYVNDGLRVAHLAVQIDHARQLPSRAAAAGLPVTLVGKAADIITCPPAEHRPAVETGEVLAQTSRPSPARPTPWSWRTSRRRTWPGTSRTRAGSDPSWRRSTPDWPPSSRSLAPTIT